MKLRHCLSLLALGALSPLLVCRPSLAAREDALVRDFDIEGDRKRIYIEVRDFPDAISDDTIE